MEFDVIFIDTTCPNPYETLTLESQPMGGTEASVIRIAEALGSLGMQVGVFQHNLDIPIMGRHAFYIPISELSKVTRVTNVVALRGNQYLDQFPKSRKFSWQHDDPTHPDLKPKLMKMRDSFLANDVTVIGVSRWHQSAIREAVCQLDAISNPQVEYIYNPVPDSIFVPRAKTVPYRAKQMIWLSSPHKGLEKAITIFNKIRKDCPDLVLHVFNPGYLRTPFLQDQGIVVRGAMPCKQVWDILINSMCVFYPTDFKETFGCFAAEANALHVPVLAYRGCGALSEVLNDKRQLVDKGYEDRLVTRCVNWYNGERPKVVGNSQFKTSEVIKQWVELLNEKK